MPVRRDDDRNHRHLLTCHFFQLLLVVFLSFKRRFGSVKCEKRFGSVNNLWGNVHPLMPFFNIPMDAIFGAPQAAMMFFFGVLPFTKRIHLRNDWAAHRVLQSEKTHHQTLLHLLLLQIKCPKKMHVFTLHWFF